MVPCPHCSFLCSPTAGRCAGCGQSVKFAETRSNTDDSLAAYHDDDDDVPAFMTQPVAVRPHMQQGREEEATSEYKPAATLQNREPTRSAAPQTVIHKRSDSESLNDIEPIENPLTDTPSPAQKMLNPRLIVVRGQIMNQRYPLLDGKNFIGRSADNPVDIDLDGQEPSERIWASRQHAVVSCENNELSLEDLNSLNGTFLNRERINPGEPQILHDGDIIQIGTVQLRVHYS